MYNHFTQTRDENRRDAIQKRTPVKFYMMKNEGCHLHACACTRSCSPT